MRAEMNLAMIAGVSTTRAIVMVEPKAEMNFWALMTPVSVS